MLSGIRRTGRAAALRSAVGLRPRAVISGGATLRRGMSALSGRYVEEMFGKWSADRASVHPSWDVYFQNNAAPVGGVMRSGGADIPSNRVIHLIRAYQVRGHELASLDPLGVQTRTPIPELDIASYGFTQADLDKSLGLTDVQFTSISGVLQGLDNQSTLRDVINVMETVYCGNIGYEFMHIPDRERCNWLREKIEFIRPAESKENRMLILERLAFAERFETFVANKWNTTKRFGIEGMESMIVGLKTSIDTVTTQGVEHIVMGMAHRGRLNVLSNVIRKPLEQIFKEFAGTNFDVDNEDWTGSGDVKYHLGHNFTRTYPDGRVVNLSMMANPSHLEAVNTVVCGKARAKMHAIGDAEGVKVMPVLIHGDAAFAGQGICYEQMQMSQLRHYQTGGTLHVVANNQVGFTTDPTDARSTRYCSDLGKTFNAPCFHVNADDPEAVSHVFALASEWRQKFHTDVIVDLVGYRRHGHNELDQPSFTQPMLYSVIAKHPTPLSIHSKRLVASGAFTQAEVDACISNVDATLEQAYENSKTWTPPAAWLTEKWGSQKPPSILSSVRKTGQEMSVLEHVGANLTVVPDHFKLHRQIGKIYEQRAKMIETKAGIDWGTAEALAFGTLLQDGVHVRLSGEDVQRGTFSHRHAVVHDQKTGETHCPLNNVPGNKSDITVCNSLLSEYGVLGFDLGYCMEDPNQLVLWEAQFGDFVNGAQIIMDQFLSSGETKWLRQCGLVMLLPHGYDGMGPDHSSCRIERFLQCSDEDPDTVPQMREDVRMQIQRSNWQIVNCTTPAQYFHVLRRQVSRDFRKPLVVVSPKSMLKSKDCTSTLEDIAEGTKFKRALREAHADELMAPNEIRRVVFCSGKVYYELLNQRRKSGVKDVAIARIEQISPFPFDIVADIVSSYPNAETVWMQEEPKNMGCWQFVQDRILTATKTLNNKPVFPAYVGRPTMASTAEGYGAVHQRQQQALLELALSDEVSSAFTRLAAEE